MGVVAAKAAIERAGVRPEQIEETIFGNARQAGGGPNPARQISVRSGVPQEVPAFTVNKACASGMKSIALAYQSILLGDSSCILAGGTESMSRLPYYLEVRAGDTASATRNSSTACIGMDSSARWPRWSWEKPPKSWPRIQDHA
jgi:acetyl-CoA acetyltransferase